MSAHLRLRVLIVGDSYVRRLQEHIGRWSKDPNFGIQEFSVSFESVGGATLARIVEELGAWLDHYQPHVLVFQVGGNDLCNGNLQPWYVADQLFRLAHITLKHRGVLKVVLGGALGRTNFPLVFPPFNAKIRYFNAWLKRLTKGDGEVVYWMHRRMINGGTGHVDGVHLNSRGNEKLYKSFRSMLMWVAMRMARVNT